jgi:hypothetical protein
LHIIKRGLPFHCPLNPDLRRNNKHHTEQNRNTKAFPPFSAKCSNSAASEGKKHTCSRYQKQQRKPPLALKTHKFIQQTRGFGVFNVKTPRIEHHSGMKRNQDTKRQDAQPVEVVRAL